MGSIRFENDDGKYAVDLAQWAPTRNVNDSMCETGRCPPSAQLMIPRRARQSFYEYSESFSSSFTLNAFVPLAQTCIILVVQFCPLMLTSDLVCTDGIL